MSAKIPAADVVHGIRFPTPTRQLPVTTVINSHAAHGAVIHRETGISPPVQHAAVLVLVLSKGLVGRLHRLACSYYASEIFFSSFIKEEKCLNFCKVYIEV